VEIVTEHVFLAALVIATSEYKPSCIEDIQTAKLHIVNVAQITVKIVRYLENQAHFAAMLRFHHIGLVLNCWIRETVITVCADKE